MTLICCCGQILAALFLTWLGSLCASFILSAASNVGFVWRDVRHSDCVGMGLMADWFEFKITAGSHELLLFHFEVVETLKGWFTQVMT